MMSLENPDNHDSPLPELLTRELSTVLLGTARKAWDTTPSATDSPSILAAGSLNCPPICAFQFRITKERYQYGEGATYDAVRIRLFQGLCEPRLMTPATRMADDREARKEEDQHEIAQCILVHKPEEQTWDCVDRYINKDLRGKGVFRSIVNAAEHWVRSFAVEHDQKLTVDNIPQKSVLSALRRLSYRPRSEEDTQNIARIDRDSTLIEAYATNPDGGEITTLDKCIFDPKTLSNLDRRPVEKALFVKLEKILPKHPLGIQRQQQQIQKGIGEALGAEGGPQR